MTFLGKINTVPTWEEVVFFSVRLY